MIEIAAEDLADATGARLVAKGDGRVCRGCVQDSRLVGPDAVFVAFPGERVDGASFARAAVDAGAGCVVLGPEPDAELVSCAEARGCAVAAADDPTEFLLRLAAAWRRELGCRVVGVTGSVGKTTTKDLLAGLLAVRYRVFSTRGNYNNLIGLPLTVLAAPRGTEVLVLEMGMNHPGEIARLAACARPSLGVITKVGTSHIGILGSREGIARAKAEIVGGMEAAHGQAPCLALAGEDDFTPFIAEGFCAPAGVDVLRCGAAATDDVRAEGVKLDELGRASFDAVLADGGRLRARLALTGAQAVPNALFAIALADRLGVPRADIERILPGLSVTGRRQEIRRAASGARVIDDSYNASPESMAAALDLLRELPCEGARIAVLGEMGELGGESARLHALTGAYAAAAKPDLAVFVGGDGARAMEEAARLMGLDPDRTARAADTDELIARFAAVPGPRDLVLVKGSRFVGLDRFVEEACADAR